MYVCGRIGSTLVTYLDLSVVTINIFHPPSNNKKINAVHSMTQLLFICWFILYAAKKEFLWNALIYLCLGMYDVQCTYLKTWMVTKDCFLSWDSKDPSFLYTCNMCKIMYVPQTLKIKIFIF